MISVIIPVFNEEAIIEKTLGQFPFNPELEIILVDGGSEDNTLELARSFPVKILTSPRKGRAFQMNWGAEQSVGEILLFLHADTILPPDFPERIQQTLCQSDVIAGAFELGIDGEDGRLRWVERMVKLRSRLLQLPYGDQGIFLKRRVFRAIDGFAPLPIMEDFDLIQRLKARGNIAIVPSPVITSARRWQKLGVVRTTLINQLIILGYYLKIPPQQLANLYKK